MSNALINNRTINNSVISNGRNNKLRNEFNPIKNPFCLNSGMMLCRRQAGMISVSASASSSLHRKLPFALHPSNGFYLNKNL
jgi:hypothetical protein